MYENVEVAGWCAARSCLALARQADAGAGIDARRNIDFEPLGHVYPPLAPAIAAG